MGLTKGIVMLLTPEQQEEIDQLRSNPQLTLRAVAPGMEDHLYRAKPVLDHGFVRVIDYMGDDAAICQAARVSYGKGTKSVQNDAGLIRYLMRHWHSTPFEMCEIKLHVKLPVFVARQWIRHRTANVNEYSARYSILDREFYIPEPESLAAQSVVNNQGRGQVLQGAEAARVLEILKSDSNRAYDNYESMISDDGQDSHAQYEIRVYADAICEMVRDWVPAAYGAFEDYRLGGAVLSAKSVECLKRMLAGEPVTQEGSGMSKGEWREFEAVIGR